jgi:superfamily II DNA/RNA helicase
MSLTFAQLGVPDYILVGLTKRGITDPFEIQTATVPDALAGRDVCGRAPTGSGKTLAFGIPLVVLVGRAEPNQPRALVLAPTRELAEQIHTEIRTFAGRVRTAAFYGGVSYGPQYRALRQGVDILVACPGRLEDLIDQNAVDLSAVDRIVVDEADRMADMGFMPSVRRLLDQTSGKRQVMLYSATLDGDVAELVRDYLRDPVRHEVSEETSDITAASHVFWDVTRINHHAVAAAAVSAVWPAIVFCRTRLGSERLAGQLEEAGIKAAAIHGGRSQNQRARALADFAKGKVEALVASDVAARGIHVEGVAAVVHYDMPEDAKTYFHRSGRTARAGKGGVVLSLVLPNQTRAMRRIQSELGLKQPFVRPDPLALRSLSPTPVRRSSAARSAVDAPKPRRSDRVSTETPGGFGDHDDRRGDTLPYRTRQEQIGDPSRNAPKPWDRRAATRPGLDAGPGDERPVAARPQHETGPRPGARDSRYDDKRPAPKPPYASGPRKNKSKPSYASDPRKNKSKPSYASDPRKNKSKPSYASDPRKNKSKPSYRDATSRDGGFDKLTDARPQSVTATPIAGKKPSKHRTTAQAGRTAQPAGRSLSRKKSGRGSPSREARRLRRHPELAT